MENKGKYPKEAGIYKLTCKNNGKIYIGKSINIRCRLRAHKNYQNKREGSCYFQSSIIKYGWDSFEVEILEILEDYDKNDLNHKKLILEREAHYIKLYNSTNKEIGYNLCEYSNDCTGIVGRELSEEHKDKIRQKSIGNKRALGHKHSKETKEKIRIHSLGNTYCVGRKLSTEHIEKIRQTNLGRKHSEESKEKMRKPLSEEHKAKLRKPKTEDHKAKMRKPKSEAHKVKLREAGLRRKLKIA